MAPVHVGSTFPEAIHLKQVSHETISDFNTDSFKEGFFVIFGVPGAFTPTCSHQHVPSFVETAHLFQEKGVRGIYCVAVNDPFVMQAWSKEFPQNHDDKVIFLADGSGTLTNALGMNLDLNTLCLGLRSKRYVLAVKDGVITHLHVEDNAGECSVSRAPHILETL